MTQEQKNFIEKVGKLAKDDAKTSGVLPSLTIAQAILESGWGKSGLTVKANALFGIKAYSSWTGKVYNCKTQECYDGKNYVTIDGCFRAYNSWEESVKDHGAFLKSLSRYKAVIGEKDYKKACKAIHEAGYATGPNYANQLINLIEQYNLTEYDKASVLVTIPNEPTTKEIDPDDYKIGDIVQFKGGPHYRSSDAVTPVVKNVKAGLAKITNIKLGKPHPYHIIHIDNTSTVYGWVDANLIAKR